ncbi:MAG: substrate-binding domain-containing protein [Chromatiales bacterium]|jgi:phosphate transport system substrate-binding protein
MCSKTGLKTGKWLKNLAFYSRALVVIAGLGLATIAPADTLRIGGTGGDLGTMRILGDAYMEQHPQDTVKVFPSLGSGGGIRALLAGKLDLAISSRPPKQKATDAGARSFVYGLTALVPVTRSEHHWDNLTSADVVSIFSGDAPRWPDGADLRLVIRPLTDSDTKILAKHIEGLQPSLESLPQRYPLVGITDQDAADLLEQVRGSFGFSSLSLVLGEKRKLKILPLDGVLASTESIAAKQYPIVKAFHLVTGPQVSPAAQRFIDFMRSDTGRQLLQDTGHVVAENF